MRWIEKYCWDCEDDHWVCIMDENVNECGAACLSMALYYLLEEDGDVLTNVDGLSAPCTIPELVNKANDYGLDIRQLPIDLELSEYFPIGKKAYMLQYHNPDLEIAHFVLAIHSALSGVTICDPAYGGAVYTVDNYRTYHNARKGNASSADYCLKIITPTKYNADAFRIGP